LGIGVYGETFVGRGQSFNETFVERCQLFK